MIYELFHDIDIDYDICHYLIFYYLEVTYLVPGKRANKARYQCE